MMYGTRKRTLTVLWITVSLCPLVWAWSPSKTARSTTPTIRRFQSRFPFQELVQIRAAAVDESSNSKGGNVAASTTTTNVVVVANTTSPQTPHPFRMAQKKMKQKIEEFEHKDRSGEKLSQAYCDSTLGLCVAYEEWESVLEVLDIMKRQGLKQEKSSYRACLQACFEAGNGGSAKEILTAMDKALVQVQPSDIALTVVAMCRNSIVVGKDAGSSWWRKALGLLKSSAAGTASSNSDIPMVVSKDNVIPVQAYDAVLQCMVEDRQWKDAVRLLRLMEEGSSSTSSPARKKQQQQQQQQQEPKTIGFHPAPEVSTYRAVIECCVSTNQGAEQAVQVLYNMKDRGVKPTTYVCELVISALSRKMQWRRAVQLMELMDQMEIPKTVVTYNTVISACARSREVGMAKNLLSKMRKDGIRPNEVSFNSVIGACASTARWQDALAILDQCYREPGVTPNIYIYTNAMRACSKGGNTNRALSLLQVVKDKGLPLDSYCYTAVIDACAKASDWKKALSLLEEMQKKGIEPTEVTYSVAISACGNGGQWKKALALLNLMRDKGLPVNKITYNAAITALSKASRNNARRTTENKRERIDPTETEGLWSRALILLKQMKDDGIEPDGFCYSSAISCCGAEGRWEEALILMKVMKRGGPLTRPNKIAYTAAISACGRAGESKHALWLFQSMKDEGLSADRVAYNAMFSALRVAGDADKTFELWGEICGTRSTSTAAIATAKDIATPDIITVTDCIATLYEGKRMVEVEQVFREAVERGIIFRGNLDSQWETDLSGMSFPVARAACRYILRQCATEKLENLKEISFITGVGRSHQKWREDHPSFSRSATKAPSRGSEKDPGTSLRDYVQEILQSDFDPPLESFVPQRAQGTVEVKKSSFIHWSKQQEPAS